MPDESAFAYHNELRDIADLDIELVKEKDVSYGSSWKRRGGIGAFMMLARKWDRLETLLARENNLRFVYDIFKHIQIEGLSGPDGSVIAEIRDLRRYLLLVEAEMIHRLNASPGHDTATQARARTFLTNTKRAEGDRQDVSSRSR